MLGNFFVSLFLFLWGLASLKGVPLTIPKTSFEPQGALMGWGLIFVAVSMWIPRRLWSWVRGWVRGRLTKGEKVVDSDWKPFR